MFTKKDRQIANQKVMIENRDKLIADLSQRKEMYRQTTNNQKEVLNEIIKLAESNPYNNEKIVLNKVKELAKTAIQD